MKKEMNDFDISNLPLIKSEISDYMPIEEYEKDKTIRSRKYPYVTHIKVEKYFYKKPDGKSVTKTITSKKLHGKKSMIDRRYKIKPFGQALSGNDGVTTIGAEVFIEKPGIVSNKNNFLAKSNRKNVPSYSSVMKTFRPSSINLDKFKNFKEFQGNTSSEIGFTKNSFIPSKLKSKLAENLGLEKFSIIIKNIPMGTEVRDMEHQLRRMFKSYGDIERLKVLSDKNDRNMCRDIAFLDFVYPSDANNLLNSGERFVIQHFILNLEKSSK